MNLKDLNEGQEIKILSNFTITLPGKTNLNRKFRRDKSYWVESVKPNGVVINYFSYNGRVKDGIISETLKFDKNKNIQLQVVD